MSGTEAEYKIGEFANYVSEHPLWREKLGRDRHALHNIVLAGLMCVLDNVPETASQSVVTRLDRQLAVLRHMDEAKP